MGKQLRLKKVKTKDKFKKLDKLSWFFIGVTLIVVGVLLVIAYDILKEPELYEEAYGYDFYSEELNFAIRIPYDYVESTTDKTDLKRVVQETTEGFVFDMSLFSLKEEVFPLTIFIPSKEGSNKPYERLMTFSFQGTDQQYSRLKDIDALKTEFKQILEGLDHKDIKITEAGQISNEHLYGVLLKAEATLEEQRMVYFRYIEPAGANILSILYGSTENLRDNKHIENISDILQTLRYFQGGLDLPTSEVEEPLVPENTEPSEENSTTDNGDGTHTHSDGTVHSNDSEESKVPTIKEDKDIEVHIDETQSSEGVEIKSVD